MDNLMFYNKLRRPPETALKLIMGGRLKGKSDINPQWRIEAMTQTFGPCGIGWKYEVVRKWTEPGTEGQLFAFVDILLYYRDNNTWSEPIPGTGGSMMIEKDKGGLYQNDEGYKMALTDALSVSMKAIGMAADIYAGMHNGSKYTARSEAEVTPAPRPAAPPATIPQPAPIKAPEGKQELTTKVLNSAIARIEKGEVDLVEKIKSFYACTPGQIEHMEQTLKFANRFAAERLLTSDAIVL